MPYYLELFHLKLWIQNISQFTLQPAGAVHSAESACLQPDPRVLVEPGLCQTP